MLVLTLETNKHYIYIWIQQFYTFLTRPTIPSVKGQRNRKPGLRTAMVSCIEDNPIVPDYNPSTKSIIIPYRINQNDIYIYTLYIYICMYYNPILIPLIMIPWYPYNHTMIHTNSLPIQAPCSMAGCLGRENYCRILAAAGGEASRWWRKYHNEWKP